MTHNQKLAFQDWLRKKQLKESSINKYATQAHNRIVKELGSSFYELSTIPELTQLLLESEIWKNLCQKIRTVCIL